MEASAQVTGKATYTKTYQSCPKFELRSNAIGCMLCYKGKRVSSVDVLIVIPLISIVGSDEEEDG